MTTRAIPDGFHTVTPYLIVEDVKAFLDFTARAFDAEATECITMPDGSIAHAEVKIGDSQVMLGGARPEWPAVPAHLYLYVEDVDAVFRRALDAGASVVQDVQDQFYGDRSGGVLDPHGISWWIATHVEDVPPEELAQRASQAHG